MKEKKRKVPKLRFPGFTDDWEQRKLGKVLNYEQPTKYLVTSTEYNDKYHIPVLTAGKSLLLGYTNETEGVKQASKDNPVIIFDDFTTSSQYVDFPFKIKSSAMKLLSAVDSKDNVNFMFNVLQNVRYEPAGHERHWISKFSEFVVRIPSDFEERQKIGQFFIQFDQLITLYQRKLEHLQLKKKALLQKLFPKAGEKYPELRFPGFTDDWEQRRLGEVTSHRGGTAIEKYFDENGEYKVISIGSYGLDSKYVDQNIRAKSNEVTNERVVHAGELTMVLNDKTANGTIIGRSLLIENDNEYVINQRTEIIKPKESFNAKFAYTLLNGPFRNKVKRIVQGGTQIYVNYSSVEKLTVPLPNMKEQQKIGSLFNQLDSLIALHQRKLDHLRLQKKALLQQMFI